MTEYHRTTVLVAMWFCTVNLAERICFLRRCNGHLPARLHEFGSTTIFITCHSLAPKDRTTDQNLIDVFDAGIGIDEQRKLDAG
ncbi:MAG TPA: hypothetical protein VGB27_11045 [Candidatus Binatia bacterium]